MEDCCAVCVEPLEWVGYGPCGHRDVCSVCIARLRFVLGDKQCCICKQDCPAVFVTKALEEYTKSVDSFDALAGRRDLWYDSNIQAYFDDEEQHKMIKSMCRLSCSVCEATESSGREFVKKGYVFRNLDQLRRHLFNAHKVHMCGLCLEGRKIFLCEQKLYTKKQLDRHLQNGNSDIDLNDEDRGWFNGHPLCNFCHTRFYGDNELYQHMSTDHFTCHLCQRAHPGQFEYYSNYDDLEAHFRHDHALCEHPECLAQKFTVFISEAELKRHNALVHGGNMSRAQRNAALQIPVSFQYRRPGQDNRGDRPFRRRDAYSNGQMSQARSSAVDSASDESSLHMDNTDDFPHFQNTEQPLPGSLSVSRMAGTEGVSSSTIEPSRYRAAVSGAGPSSFIDSAFPPLPGSESSEQKSKQQVRGSPLTMASMLGGGGRRRLLNKGNVDQIGTSVRDVPRNLIPPAKELSQWPQVSTSQRPQSDTQVVRQSPVFSRGMAERPCDDLPSSASDKRATVSAPLSDEELRAANKALRASIQSVLQGDDKRYSEFKLISAQFRGGEINADEYLGHVKEFGLLHIVSELARLCPDEKKKEDLSRVYQRHLTSLEVNGFTEHLLSSSGGSSQEDDVEETKKKLLVGGISGLRLTDRGEGYTEENVVEVLSKDGYRSSKAPKSYFSAANRSAPQNKQVKVLVKAERSAQRPSELSSSSHLVPTVTEGTVACSVCTLEMKEGSTHCVACGTPFPSVLKPGGSEVQASEKKKNKKGIKLRMGDGSTAALLDSGRRTWAVDAERGNGAPAVSSGAWGNGGGQGLASLSQRRSGKESSSSGH